MANRRTKNFCNRCKLDSNQEILFSHQETFHDEEQGVYAVTEWQVIKCCGCETISFREVEEFSEDCDPETGRIIPTIRAYPVSERDAISPKPFHNVPRKIRGIYRETVDAYNRGSRTLCAGGIRAAIEGICGDKRVTDGPVVVKKKRAGTTIVRQQNLRGRINGLQERGIITKGLQDSLHEHRFLGNEALHELDPPEREELCIAIGLLEHTLEHVYEVADRVAELRALKKKRKKQKK